MQISDLLRRSGSSRMLEPIGESTFRRKIAATIGEMGIVDGRATIDNRGLSWLKGPLPAKMSSAEKSERGVELLPKFVDDLTARLLATGRATRLAKSRAEATVGEIYVRRMSKSRRVCFRRADFSEGCLADARSISAGLRVDPPRWFAFDFLDSFSLEALKRHRIDLLDDGVAVCSDEVGAFVLAESIAVAFAALSKEEL